MAPSTRTETLDVYGRISALIRADARNGSEWALLLGLGRQALHDRLKGRTRWTLCDAVTIAGTLGMSLDLLVGDEDLPLGYAPGPDIPRTGAEHIDTMVEALEAEEVMAEVATLRLHPVPAYEDVDA